MKKVVHKATGRGFANHGWLQAHHSFSFANWYDPNRMQFGALRVLNDDIIAPGMGFSTHPHQNMEIITIPLSGALKHRDSMEEEWQTVAANQVQVMSAGSGIYHSEMNASTKAYLSLFQIWILPYEVGVTPRYDQKAFDPTRRKDELQILVSSFTSKAHEESLKIHQNAQLSRIDMSKGTTYEYQLSSEDHGVYVMNISGEVSIADEVLAQRDAIGISATSNFSITAIAATELLFIEVPMLL